MDEIKIDCISNKTIKKIRKRILGKNKTIKQIKHILKIKNNRIPPYHSIKIGDIIKV